MEPLTNVTNTKNWLEASRGIRIRAYIESYTPTLSVRERPFPSGNLYDSLRKVSVLLPTKCAATLEPQLDIEFQAWDILSDEALVNFELELA